MFLFTCSIHSGMGLSRGEILDDVCLNIRMSVTFSIFDDAAAHIAKML